MKIAVTLVGLENILKQESKGKIYYLHGEGSSVGKTTRRQILG